MEVGNEGRFSCEIVKSEVIEIVFKNMSNHPLHRFLLPCVVQAVFAEQL